MQHDGATEHAIRAVQFAHIVGERGHNEALDGNHVAVVAHVTHFGRDVTVIEAFRIKVHASRATYLKKKKEKKGGGKQYF